MNRLVAALVGLLAALVGLLSMPGPAVALVAQPMPAYTYDGDQHPVQTNTLICERGPPAQRLSDCYNPDGLAPLGVSVRPDAPTAASSYDYDDPSGLVWPANRSEAVKERVADPAVGLAHVVRSDVAANTAVMGRNMGQRVIPDAERNGYGFYKGTPKYVPRKTIARTTSPATLDKVDLRFNKRWINSQMRNGNRIVDIGEPPGYPSSPFYDMERQQVGGYWNYVQDIQP